MKGTCGVKKCGPNHAFPNFHCPQPPHLGGGLHGSSRGPAPTPCITVPLLKCTKSRFGSSPLHSLPLPPRPPPPHLGVDRHGSSRGPVPSPCITRPFLRCIEVDLQHPPITTLPALLPPPPYLILNLPPPPTTSPLTTPAPGSPPHTPTWVWVCMEVAVVQQLTQRALNADLHIREGRG